MNDPAERLNQRIFNALQRLRILDDSLRAVPEWLAAADLAEEVEGTRRRISDLAEEKERKMAVVIVGPTGAGKSTLLNALAGRDDLAKTGLERPTTKTLTVFCADPEDGRYFSEKAGAHNTRIVSTRQAKNLRNLVIIDTPDTNSAEADEHKPIVAAAIRAADVLLCVFPVENVARRDQIEYLNGWVAQFNHSALYAVVTMSEKLSRSDLERDVLAPLDGLLAAVWGKSPARIFSVSARTHLQNPHWDAVEGVHPEARDDFPELQRELAEKFNSMEAVADMRGARAEVWAKGAERMVGRQAAQAAPYAHKACRGIATLGKDVWHKAVNAADTDVSMTHLSYSVASRLWGPVSWFFMAWTFIIFLLEILSALAGALRRVRMTFSFWSEGGGGTTEPVSTDFLDVVTGMPVGAWQDIRSSIRHAGFSQKAQEDPLAPPYNETIGRLLQSRVFAERDGLLRRMADSTFTGTGTAMLLNFLFLFPVLYLVFTSVRIFLSSGTLNIGIGGDGLWFIALWWVLVLAFMHGWIYFKERRVDNAARREFLAGRSQVIPLAPDVMEGLKQVIALANEYGAEGASRLE